VVVGWDFSTGAVKCLAFAMDGEILAEVRLPTDLWTAGGVSELNLFQLEGQARAGLRAIADRLRELGRLRDWQACGISATHHTAGRINADYLPVRRAICWNDHSLSEFHARGLARLGGQDQVIKLIGGPWAIRYTLSHLVKDEAQLSLEDWRRTKRILPHGPLAAGYLTGNFEVISVSAAASTGILNLRSAKWCRSMLKAIGDARLRALAWKQLPRVIDQFEPVGPLSSSLALENGIKAENRPWVFPTSDDQAAGLVGGGAVDAGQVAIILGNSAVVNSSSKLLPRAGNLDAMRLNWGPYLWMRCFNNGAQFLDKVIGPQPNWLELERHAALLPPGQGGIAVLPFCVPEPSLGVREPIVRWFGEEPKEPGRRFRAALEGLAYLIALGVREHQQGGQQIERITVSGGIARSNVMCEILAAVLHRPVLRLCSDEGPALGAAVTALAALENKLRRRRGIRSPFSVADAVPILVKFRDTVAPKPQWRTFYSQGLEQFAERLRSALAATGQAANELSSD
jgi:sugar (pentulose or hexulose) kinase